MQESNRLRHLRVGSGLGLNETARQLGIDPSLLSRYERGLVEIPDERKQQLAEFYGCSRAHVMGWDEAPLLSRGNDDDDDGDDGDHDGERQVA